MEQYLTSGIFSEEVPNSFLVILKDSIEDTFTLITSSLYKNNRDLEVINIQCREILSKLGDNEKDLRQFALNIIRKCNNIELIYSELVRLYVTEIIPSKEEKMMEVTGKIPSVNNFIVAFLMLFYKSPDVKKLDYFQWKPLDKTAFLQDNLRKTLHVIVFNRIKIKASN